jgi:hypothetical protein
MLGATDAAQLCAIVTTCTMSAARRSGPASASTVVANLPTT